MLNQPIQATDPEICPPDKLEKITITPAPETIRLDGGTLTGTEERRRFSVDIGVTAKSVPWSRNPLDPWPRPADLRRYYGIALPAAGPIGRWI